MPAKIETLIDKTDYVEQVRDQIGAILLVEQQAQQQLALENGKNPKHWKLRVFVERSNAWAEFQDLPDPNSNMPDDDTSPIVNVWFDRSQVDPKKSDVVQKQQYDGTFKIDCYGYGVATASLSGGHDPGDARAAFEAQRAARLVRNILMAGHYVTLGMSGVVAQRMVQAIQSFQPQIDDRPAQRIVGCRLSLGVDFKELSPQVQGQPLELISLEVTRMETGELYLEHQIDFVDS
jgi:hypothetical protein